MGEMKEEISIHQVHETADRFIVTRRMVEEMNGEQLKKVYSEILKGEFTQKTNLELIPKQVTEREKLLRKEIATLTQRREAFEPFAKKLGWIPEEQKPQEQATVGPQPQ